MSMQVLTLIQWFFSFAVYLFVTVALPAVVLGPCVRKYRMTTRFFFYYISGNFYVINLVYLLELLHISYRTTLILATVIPAFLIYIRVRGIPVADAVRQEWQQLDRFMRGTFGAHNFLRRRLVMLCKILYRTIQKGLRLSVRYIFDIVMFAGLFALMWHCFGYRLTEVYGYCASDIPVHNFWINYLGKNQVFVAGVYPFGFHCMIYYLHAVFGIDTYVLLRVFWFVQVLMIYGVLVIFLRGCCKSIFVPYLAVFLILGTAFSRQGTYLRYYSTLPQEYGMLFIFPAAWFAFEFFRLKKLELQADKKAKQGQSTEILENQSTAVEQRRKPESRYFLWGFAMSFSLSFTVHFYDTMILGIFCVGIACGYFFRFLRPGYFGKVVGTCFAGLGIALLPMVVAVMLGTPLQGSLGWGLYVIASGGDQQEQAPMDEEGVVYYFDQYGNRISEAEAGFHVEVTDREDGENGNSQIFDDGGYISEDRVKNAGFLERLRAKLIIKYRTLNGAFRGSNFADEYQDVGFSVYYAIIAVFVLGLIFFLLRRPDRGAMYWSAAVYLCGMLMLQAAALLGLPQLMDMARCCIFLNYSLPLIWALAMDGVLYLFLGMWKHKQPRILMQICSLALLAGGVYYIYDMGWQRRPDGAQNLQSNGAMTCTTNIISENKDWTWTIVSANDEYRIAEDHGYHYELIDFLKKMEYSGGYSSLTIPTPKVYFYFEKIPLDYSEEYENSGQRISAEGASHYLPSGGGISIYQGERRWILMSRMYYWIQEYQKMFPNEMKLYYEDDEFVCYVIEQNAYYLNNFSIDYGYNMQDSPRIEVTEDGE